MNESEIRDLFATHKVTLGAKDVWAVQGTPVIKHSALERLSAVLKLAWDMPTVIRSERDECVVMARATRQDGIAEWSFGEALIAGIYDGVTMGNYKVSPKQASYVYAMAEKRAKDRVIIKLAGLHGAYSEEEADEFKAGRTDNDDATSAERSRKAEPQERISPAMAYLAKARTDMLAFETPGELMAWWEAASVLRRDAGLTKDNEVGKALIKAFNERKASLTHSILEKAGAA